MFINSRKGCKKGDKCTISHDPFDFQRQIICRRYFGAKKFCQYGYDCGFKHALSDDLADHLATLSGSDEETEVQVPPASKGASFALEPGRLTPKSPTPVPPVEPTAVSPVEPPTVPTVEPTPAQPAEPEGSTPTARKSRSFFETQTCSS